MNWHTRYTQQAKWTRDLRAYLFDKAGLDHAGRVHRTASLVLEVGCGTGAILSELPAHLSLHGLDSDPAALAQCRVHAPAASLTRGEALRLPYAEGTFDIAYCHYLLLWVSDPRKALLEMKRVTKPGGHLLALAEPDHTARVDKPDELARLGHLQTESLKRQGADPGFGARLAETLFQAGIEIIETGTIQSAANDPSPDEWEMEWAVIESDLAGWVPEADIHKMKVLDRHARARRERVFHVPTYFAWGRA